MNSIFNKFGIEPTVDEKKFIHSLFPELKDGEWRKTDNATQTYNCIAWSLCNSSGWIDKMIDHFGNNNGKVDLNDMDKFYELQGFTSCGSSIIQCLPELGKKKIALFCLDGEPTHAAKQIDDNDIWESKLGANIRIVHRLNQLEHGKYGKVCRCYCRKDNKPFLVENR